MRKEAICTFVFVALLTIFKFNFHEFWKDEWQAWLVARDLPLFKMLAFLNYEGHPSLWYVYLKLFTFFAPYADEASLLIIAHTIPIFLCTYLLFVKTKLPLLFKVLIAFSYFYCFEYGVINRGYIWVWVLTLLASLSILDNKSLLFSIYLFLLCQTEVYGVFIGFSIIFYYYYTRGFKNLSPIYCYAAGVMVFIMTVYPRGNSDDFARAYNESVLSLTTIFNSIQGLLANTFTIGLIPDTATFGYTNFGLLLSLSVFVYIYYLFFSEKSAVYVWLIGLLLFLLFSVCIFTGGVRQWGFLYLLFIAIIILNPKIYQVTIKYWLVVFLLLPPVYHNIKALYKDMQINFSNARDAGIFIKNKIPANVAIVSLNKFETAGAAAYANRKMFEMPSGNTFTYFRWLEKNYVPTQSELMLFAKYKGAKGLIVVSSYPVDKNRFPILKLWKKFDSENFKSEEFYFYMMDISGRN